MCTVIRRRFIISGQVQGVGFRPFVYRLACARGLCGFVGNTEHGVSIEVQGEQAAVALFTDTLEHSPPPLARIQQCLWEDIPLQTETSFRIVTSHAGTSHAVRISPDIAVCADCLADMRDPHNRRYQYPFTNCTNCGPRYTITKSIPYDRATTSMACFPQCALCQKEYENPMNRRFHAQPNACVECGAQLAFERTRDAAVSTAGAEIFFTLPDKNTQTQHALEALAQALCHGDIAAIKGLGGFHLACDAHNEEAIALLRQRKHRPHKALAVMVDTLQTARKYALIDTAHALCLQSPEAPMVLCPRTASSRSERCGQKALPELLAPDSPQLGIMLPYTPLHHEIMRHCGVLGLDALVMTSGNAAGDPICLGNREARTRLAPLADCFLFHNRDILIRVDDSVIDILPDSLHNDVSEISADTPVLSPPLVHSASVLALSAQYPVQYVRRARGFVPAPLPITTSACNCVLGTGAELKATLCLSRGSDAFVSQHLGDLDSLGAQTFFEETVAHLSSLLMVKPQCVVHDLHPDFFSSRWAERYAQQHSIPVFSLQHHFAHIHAVLAEHPQYRDEPILGLALDGTGLGDDATIWGGELLFIDAPGKEQYRLGRLRPFALAGGDAATREPWRIAHALWKQCGLEPEKAPWFFEHAAQIPVIDTMIARSLNTPQCSSCGRLFDAVSAWLGICVSPTYEGQAAIRLEHAQESTPPKSFTIPLNTQSTLLELDTAALFAQLVDMRQHGASVAQLASVFHQSLASGFAHMAAVAARREKCRTIALAGGVLHNSHLLQYLCVALQNRGLHPLLPKNLPPNDGALSLGQVSWAVRYAM